jgi:HK97 family phage major capsid protein
VEDLKNQIETLKSLETKSADLEKAIAKFEGRLEGMSEKALNNNVKPMSMAQAIAKAYVDNHTKIKETAEKGGMLTLDVKSTTITNDYDGNIALSVLETGVNNIARPAVKIRNIVNLGTTTSKFVTYIAQQVQTEADWTEEGGLKVLGTPQWKEVSEEVKKIAGTIKVSKEMLDDLSFIRSEINRDLMASVEDGMENALLNGAGGASINGILSVAQAFAPASFALSIPSANISDVLMVASAQVQSANFEPTHVVLHPNDVAKIKLTKGTDGTYTYPIFLTDANGNMLVANLVVVSTTNMTEGDFLVGDFTKSNVRIREAMNVQVGYVNDDFQRNMVTILAEMRLVQYVKENDVNAFVTGTIATAITAIDKP